MRMALPLLVLSFLISSTSLTADAASANKAPLKIYVSPEGSDAYQGDKASKAVASLERVQQLVIAQTKTNPRNVQVLFEMGTYHDQHVKWTYSMPKHSITFEALRPTRARPIFDGCRTLTDGSLKCLGRTWFVFHPSAASKGQPAGNIHFKNLRIMHYTGAMILGSNDRPTSGNTIDNLSFYKIGNSYLPDVMPYAFSAISLSNASNTKITNSQFLEVSNVITAKTPRREGDSKTSVTSLERLIHGIYVVNNSHNNVIAHNVFEKNSGHPIKLRNNSNGNKITGNEFRQSTSGDSRIGAVQDWYATQNREITECPSWNNVVENNKLDGSFRCDRALPAVEVWDSLVIGKHCPIKSGKRVVTKNNISSTRPCSLKK